MRRDDRKKKNGAKEDGSPAQRIDVRAKELADWRGKTLSRLRALIKEADPDVVEERKWKKATSPGVPVWSHHGMICTGETYKTVVKLTFFKGASLKDPSGLFNSSLEGNARRAIDFHEGEAVDERAFKALIRAAVRLNESSGRGRREDPLAELIGSTRGDGSGYSRRSSKTFGERLLREVRRRRRR